MDNQRIDNLGTAIAEATMVAAIEILHSLGKTDSVDLDALIVELRIEAKVASSAILADGKALLAAGRSPWLGEMFKAETVAAARRAVATVTG